MSFLKMLTVLMITLVMQVALAADDVFLDEGEGDFSLEPPIENSAPPAQQDPGAAAAAMDELSIPEDAAPQASEAPKVAKQSKPSKKADVVVKSNKKNAGRFSVTKASCSMHRSPASTSEKMLKVKASRKLWVEDVNGKWVRGYNAAGKPGYISKDCF